MRLRTEQNLENAKRIFNAKIADALGHPLRIEIIEYVAEKNSVRNDICNGELVSKLPVSQATVSQHIKRLVEAEILIVRRENGFSFYTVNQVVLHKFLENIGSFISENE
ncbi:MAG: ArsR family transcriptional regulator [Acidobacteriota bacterium]